MSAIKATQKLDMLGIGMQHQKDPNGIAWRQNRDFENMLRRLNEGTNAVTGPFHKAREEESLKGWEGGEQTSTSEAGNLRNMNEDERDGDEDEDEVVIAKKEKKKKKKRKAMEALEEEDPHDKEKRKKRKKLKGGDDHNVSPSDDEALAPPPESSTGQNEEPAFAPTTAVIAPVPIRAPYVAPHPHIPRISDWRANRTSDLMRLPLPFIPHRSPRTHRARIIAAKRMAASNSTALAEILGIPSSSTSSHSSPYPSTAITPTHTPTPVPAAEEQEPLTKLTTSSQSVGDYFKAKLSAKVRGERHPRLTVATGDNAATPTWDDDGDDHRPGLGLGLASRMLATEELNEEHAGGGIGATKSSKFAAMLTQGQPAADSREDNAAAAIEPVEAHDDADQDDDCTKREKKRAREERRREKEERRRRKAEAYRLEDAVVDVPVGEASAGRTKKKKRDEPGDPDGDTQLLGVGRTEAIRTKNGKGDKGKKSAKDRGPTG
jgi:Pin2-interacting protein X1